MLYTCISSVYTSRVRDYVRGSGGGQPRAKHLAVITKLSFNSAVHSRPRRDLIRSGGLCLGLLSQPCTGRNDRRLSTVYILVQKERYIQEGKDGGRGRNGFLNLGTRNPRKNRYKVIDESEAPLTICLSSTMRNHFFVIIRLRMPSQEFLRSYFKIESLRRNWWK